MEVDIENRPDQAQECKSATATIPTTPQPLQPVSSDRQNQQRLLTSPHISQLDGSDSARKHRLSDAADVRARIAYLNSISQNNSPTRSTSPTKPSMLNVSHAAIQRAILGREEAETAMGSLSAQLESAKARERMVSERVENLMQQLNEVRNRQKHERTVYEKEIKQSKKTEYKAELAVIKLQEDLREVRSELEGTRVRSEHERAEKEKARQEAFERAYAVAGMTEELQDVKRRLEVMEQERDAAVAMAASKLPIDVKQVEKEVVNQPETSEKRKQPVATIDMPFEDGDMNDANCAVETKLAILKQENESLMRKIEEDHETIHFMNMQCQFKACACRIAERNGVRFVYDYEYDAKVRARNAKRRKVEDLEPQLPLPTFKSLKRKQDEMKGKQSIKQKIVETVYNEPVSVQPGQISAQHNPTVVERLASDRSSNEQLLAPLPPMETLAVGTENMDQITTLEEAASIPLPSFQPMEIDPSDDTPEQTAQLEDLTQVIVEPSTSANDFLFRASTTSNKTVIGPISALSRSQDIRMSDDLFDISPPKKQLPPRPSTALGVSSVGSPIRVVPNSPQVWEQRSLTPDVNLPRPVVTHVALNDTSPVRQSRQHRNQTRPHMPERVRGRSPASQRMAGLDRSSPGPGTVFPITPATKHDRSGNRDVIQQRPQTAQDHYPSDRGKFTKTTTVPLRDESSLDKSLHVNTSTGTDGPASAPVSATASTFSVPGTPNMTREQALAQIRARRDRARSVNMRKSADAGVKTPGSVARRGVNLREKLADVHGRDFSAPGRI